MNRLYADFTYEVPETTYENDVDVLVRSAEVVSVIPPTYLREYTTQIMDVIEQLENAIGVRQ